VTHPLARAGGSDRERNPPQLPLGTGILAGVGRRGLARANASARRRAGGAGGLPGPASRTSIVAPARERVGIASRNAGIRWTHGCCVAQSRERTVRVARRLVPRSVLVAGSTSSAATER